MAQARQPDRTKVRRDDEYRIPLAAVLTALNVAPPDASEVFISVIGKVGEPGARVTVKVVRPESG